MSRFSPRALKRFGFIFAPFVLLVMVMSGIPLVASVTPIIVPASATSTSSTASTSASTNSHLAPAWCIIRCVNFNWPNIALPSGLQCFLPFPASPVVIEAIFGPGCGVVPTSSLTAINMQNEQVAAKNLMTTLYNYLNITNSETANLNATFQELLSYYSARAEAVVPYFLNQTWNTTIYDAIAVISGLVPSLEGIETAIAYQQFQDWNATVNGWDAAFGSGGAFSGDSAALQDVVNNVPGLIALNGYDAQVTPPYEFWTAGAPIHGTGGNVTYFNMGPDGTVVDANYLNATGNIFGNYTVYDLTQGTHFTVPAVSYYNWTTGNVPLEAKLHNVSQFDLLKLVCTANCVDLVTDTVETSAAYAMENISNAALGTNFFDSMVPQLGLINDVAANLWVNVPQTTTGVCITLAPSPETGPCYAGQVVPTGGNSTALSAGPGSVVAGNKTLLAFASTAQSLVNNTMILAYDYYQTLRAITDKGVYAIPPNCAIPTPSDAFPTATDFVNYQLSANDVEAVYLAYLNAVAREYGEVFTNQVGFCGDPNLGFSFNWTGSWKLLLNITASVYIGTNGTPLELNGTPDASISYSNVASWPVYNVDPTLLYPFEYQMNVPVGKIYPVPINNPLVGVLVNYPGNLYYGQKGFTPEWGIPTYVSLTGNGNYSYVSGNLSNIQSGSSPASGDAIEINSCVLNGIPKNPCDISVTYFNNFTIGLVHSILPPVPYPGGPGLTGQTQAICGTGAMNQWYDAWAGLVITGAASIFVYIGDAASSLPVVGGALDTFFTDLGCLVGYIVLILVFVGLFILIAWLIRLWRG